MRELDDDLLVANGQIDPNAESDDLDSNAGKDLRGTRVAGTAVAVGSERKLNSDSSTAYDFNSDSSSSAAYENDSESDSRSVYEPDDEDDCDTDDDCGAGPEETRAFLYPHFTITIVPHSTPWKPNMVFMKAYLLHTKGEDNKLRMYATLASPVSHLSSLICLYQERRWPSMEKTIILYSHSSITSSLLPCMTMPSKPNQRRMSRICFG